MSDSEPYFTAAKPFTADYRVKDSRFIAHLAPAVSKEAAEAFIQKVARQHADATHHCYAYRIGIGDSCLYRADDAGEPAGTAGRPILQALKARNISDSVLVVTRYFGGTKLGIGGLIRAYGGAAFHVLDQAPLLKIFPKVIRTVAFPYEVTGAVHQILQQYKAHIIKTEFNEQPVLEYSVTKNEDRALADALKNATRGKIQYL